MAADRKAVVEQINKGFAENNLEKVLSFCTDDFSWTMVRGDMMMRESKDAMPHSYSFCDIYRFKGDRVAELTSFVIKTDGAQAHHQTHQEVGRAL